MECLAYAGPSTMMWVVALLACAVFPILIFRGVRGRQAKMLAVLMGVGFGTFMIVYELDECLAWLPEWVVTAVLVVSLWLAAASVLVLVCKRRWGEL